MHPERVPYPLHPGESHPPPGPVLAGSPRLRSPPPSPAMVRPAEPGPREGTRAAPLTVAGGARGPARRPLPPPRAMAAEGQLLLPPRRSLPWAGAGPTAAVQNHRPPAPPPANKSGELPAGAPIGTHPRAWLEDAAASAAERRGEGAGGAVRAPIRRRLTAPPTAPALLKGAAVATHAPGPPRGSPGRPDPLSPPLHFDTPLPPPCLPLGRLAFLREAPPVSHSPFKSPRRGSRRASIGAIKGGRRGGRGDSGGRGAAEAPAPAPGAAMDFNVKKLASDAGVFFSRAMQVRRAGPQRVAVVTAPA